jgi:ketopantoate reductase
MRADMARGKTEVSDFNGAIAREAKKLGLEAPINAGLAALTQELAAHPDRRDQFRGRPHLLVDHLRLS